MVLHGATITVGCSVYSHGWCSFDTESGIGTLGACGESDWGSKEGSVMNEIGRHPVPDHQAGKCKFLQTRTLAAGAGSPNATPHLGSSRLKQLQVSYII